MVAAGSLAFAAPASATSGSGSGCTQSGATVSCAVSFSFTGSEQEFVVPAGITSMSATAIGARGGRHAGGPYTAVGGLGASVSQSFTVVPGQSLFVEVGGNGSDWIPGGSTAPGGFNGGGAAPGYYGNGGGFDLGGGAGGGASDVRTAALTAPGTLGSRLVVAAGGGGAGIQGYGGNAGSAGGPNAYNSAGGAGSAAGGGAGGISSNAGSPTGMPGTLGVGGSGSSSGGGGGGGGGLYGGGGASTYGAGGGGSSLGTVNGVTASAASVTLAYTSTVSELSVAASAVTVSAGDTATFSAVGTDPQGDSWDATSSTTFTSSDDSDTVAGNAIRFGTAGPRTVTATDQGVTATVGVSVEIGPESDLVVTPSSSTVGAGDTAGFTARAMDAGGDDLGDVTSATTFTSSDGSDSVAGNAIRFGTAGSRTVSADDGTSAGSATVVVTVGPLATMTVSASAATIVAGGTATVTATGRDAGGDDLGDVSSGTTFTSSDDSDAVSGTSITFGTSGPRTITGTNGAVLNTTGVTVTVGPPATLSVQGAPSSVVAGGMAVFSATATDAGGDVLGDVTSATTFTSSDSSDSVTGSTIVFGTAGTRTITATDGDATASVSVDVAVGPIAALVVTSSPGSVTAGDSVTLSATATDAVGDDLGDVTSALTFTSSNSADVVSGSSIRFGMVGSRTITGTDGTTSGTTTVMVTVGALASIAVEPSVVAIVAGGSGTFTATGYDAEGNSLGDITPDVVFTSADASDSIDDNVVGFTAAGVHTVTATSGGVSAEVQVTVTADAAAPAAIAVHASSASVARGGSITLSLTGVDAYGNPIADLTDRATFTSNWAVDIIDGSTITFPHASVHIITATVGRLQSTVAVTVIPPASEATATPAAGADTARGALASTGSDTQAPLETGLGALLLGLLTVLGAAAVRRRAENRQL